MMRRKSPEPKPARPYSSEMSMECENERAACAVARIIRVRLEMWQRRCAESGDDDAVEADDQ